MSCIDIDVRGWPQMNTPQQRRGSAAAGAVMRRAGLPGVALRRGARTFQRARPTTTAERIGRPARAETALTVLHALELLDVCEVLVTRGAHRVMPEYVARWRHRVSARAHLRQEMRPSFVRTDGRVPRRVPLHSGHQRASTAARCAARHWLSDPLRGAMALRGESGVFCGAGEREINGKAETHAAAAGAGRNGCARSR